MNTDERQDAKNAKPEILSFLSSDLGGLGVLAFKIEL